MSTKRTLISWIGVTDIDHSRGVKAGSPLSAVARHVTPECIHILWAEDDDKVPFADSVRYRKWLINELGKGAPSNVVIHRVAGSGGQVMDFGWIYKNIEDELGYLASSPDPICINASSGTSMMTASWIVWSKTVQRPAIELYVSSPESGVKRLQLPPGLQIDLRRVLAFRDDDQVLDRYLSGELFDRSPALSELLGKSRVFDKVRYQVKAASPFDVPILILGEPGTGKSVIAQAIHRIRYDDDVACKRFVVVDCGQLFGATEVHNVFGWKRNAFTGADDHHPGLIFNAQNGTLFLDEVGNAPPEIQANLLRILQEGKYRRMGELEERNSNARVIAATNAPLPTLVKDRRFRQDLLDRLSCIVIDLPPLRDRRADIVEMAKAKLKEFQENAENREAMVKAQMSSKLLTADAQTELTKYDWPGNVRELEHVMARLVVFSDPKSGEITSAHVRQELRNRRTPVIGELLAAEPGPDFSLEDLVLRVQEQFVRKAAALSKGSRTEMARLLGFGKSRTPLNTILEKLKAAGRPFDPSAD